MKNRPTINLKSISHLLFLVTLPIVTTFSISGQIYNHQKAAEALATAKIN